MKNKKKDNQYIFEGNRTPAEERLRYVRCVARNYGLTHRDLTLLTGYSLNSVHGWFTKCTSARHRDIPARAFDRLQLELIVGQLKSIKPVRG